MCGCTQRVRQKCWHARTIVPRARVDVHTLAGRHAEGAHVLRPDVVTVTRQPQADRERHHLRVQRKEQLSSTRVVVTHPQVQLVAAGNRLGCRRPARASQRRDIREGGGGTSDACTQRTWAAVALAHRPNSAHTARPVRRVGGTSRAQRTRCSWHTGSDMNHTLQMTNGALASAHLASSGGAPKPSKYTLLVVATALLRPIK
jgi:hypothetical protein